MALNPRRTEHIGDSDPARDCIVAAGSVFTGDIQTDGHIRVDGEVKGNIAANGDIHIGAGARVAGDLKAAGIQIAGSLTGNASTEGSVTLFGNARMNGDITASSFSVGNGACFNGAVDIPPGTQKAQATLMLKKQSRRKLQTRGEGTENGEDALIQ
jgi:cytoskeletal protein CcmA (bactofilin family)